MKRALLAGLCATSLLFAVPTIAFAQPVALTCEDADEAVVEVRAELNVATNAQVELAVAGDLGVTVEEVLRLEAVLDVDPDREAELQPRIDAIDAVLDLRAQVELALGAADREVCTVPNEPDSNDTDTDRDDETVDVELPDRRDGVRSAPAPTVIDGGVPVTG